MDEDFLGGLTSERNRQYFLSKNARQAFQPAYSVPQQDANIELAKRLAFSQATPNPGLMHNPEKSAVDAERLILMD